MKCIALVIDINEYEHNPTLKNAESDAIAIANKLMSLKFEIILLVGNDTIYGKYLDAYETLCDKLFQNKYDVILLYFSGHDMMSNMSDCLLLKDTASM